MAAPPLAFEAGFTVGEQIEARAKHPEASKKTVLMQGDRRWTYAEFRDQSVRMAHFLRGRLGAIDEQRAGHVAMVLENHLELLALYGHLRRGDGIELTIESAGEVQAPVPASVARVMMRSFESAHQRSPVVSVSVATRFLLAARAPASSSSSIRCSEAGGL